MAKYKKIKPRRVSRATRVRKPLDQMAAANERELSEVSIESCEVGVRARLQAQHPERSPREIEERVARVMAAGSKSTPAALPTPGAIPPEVLAARRAEQKKNVKANGHVRRQDEIERKNGVRTPPGGRP